jgi:hypothetical protein
MRCFKGGFRDAHQDAQLLDGIKATWGNIFSQLAESFSEGLLGGDCPGG